jgi:hypothetical protein
MAFSDRDTDRDGLHLFNIDLHVSVIADVKNILARWGHRITDWTLSNHSWVFGRRRDPIDVINENTWQALDAEMCKAFYRRYRNEFEHFDGFVVTHTPAFALLFIQWGKPIIIVNTTRYEQPFTLREPDWRWLDQELVDGVQRGQLRIVSNNKGDQAYLHEHAGLHSAHMPSLCDYTGAAYRGRRRRFVLQARAPELPRRLPWTLRRRFVLSHDMVQDGRLFRRRPYRWRELYDFRGFVHIPYQISTMSICEQYRASVPLFFPSKSFLLESHVGRPNEVLSQLSFFQVSDVQFCNDGLNRTQDPDVVRRWIDLADYYDPEYMPFIQYFESYEHLAELLDTVDADAVSQQMRVFNVRREQRILDAWRGLLVEVFGRDAAEARSRALL